LRCAGLEDELLRQRAVSATQSITAYRLDAMMGNGTNGAVARMTFTRTRECCLPHLCHSLVAFQVCGLAASCSLSALANPVFAVKMLFNYGSRSSSLLRAEGVGDFDVLCELPTHPGIVYVYAKFVDTLTPGTASLRRVHSVVVGLRQR
jgi:hypothetical protein